MKMLLDKRFLHFVPLVVSRGFSSACLGGIFVPFWVSVQQNLSDLTEKQKEAQALSVIVLFGLGQVVAAPTVGIILDKFGNRTALSFILALNILSFSLILVINEIHTFTWTAWLGMFGLGFMDNSTNCFQNIVCGF